MKTKARIQFGTDGWRALMSKEFTVPNVERLAQAFAGYILEGGTASFKKARPSVVVGFDHRKNSEAFAAAFAGILLANGIETLLSDRALPTPAVSYAVIHQRSDAGIMITASHNPPEYNGVKIKSSRGSSADTSITKAVEERMDRSPILRSPPKKIGGLRRDFVSPYLENLRRYLDWDAFSRKPYRVLVDAMHGTGDRLIETVLKGSALKVETMRGEKDTRFGGVNPEPIPKNMEASLSRMKEGTFDIAIATDGDADRVGMIRPGGEFVTAGTLLSLLLLHVVQDLGRTGSVVTTVSNTSLIRRVAKDLGLEVRETAVGFKHVCQVMQQEKAVIGGEESGGLAFQDYMPERDGLLAGLLMIQMMEKREKSFDEILRDTEGRFGKFYYMRKDIACPDEIKKRLFSKLEGSDVREVGGMEVLGKKTYDGVKFLLEGDAWLLLRLSGTEPLLRIYAESTDPGTLEGLIQWGEHLVSGTG